MPNEQTITLKGRTVYKHMTEARWNDPENRVYIPLASEKVIYDRDEYNRCARMKIGDGNTPVCDLPFVQDLSVADWAREVAIPSCVYKGSTHPDQLENEYGEVMEGRYDIWFDPTGTGYVYELTDAEKREIANTVAEDFGYYCHHIQLAFRDPQVTNKEDDTTDGMFTADFDIITFDPESFGFAFNRALPDTPSNPDYLAMSQDEAWKLFRLYRAMQLSNELFTNNEISPRPASGSMYKKGKQSPIQGIATTYKETNYSVDSPFYGKYVRIIQVQGSHPGTDSQGRLHLNPQTASLKCGLTTLAPNDLRLEETNTDATWEAFANEYKILEENHGVYDFYCNCTLICRDAVERLVLKPIDQQGGN